MRVCKRGCVKLTFWARKIRILESIFFAKQELITRSRLRGQDFSSGKNFSFNHCNAKSFAFFVGKFIL